MDSVSELIRNYLPEVNIMQLATAVGDQAWICTVHYYSDESLNLYWVSSRERRHSKEIQQNKKVAATILVHENNEAENYVIAITIEGIAELVGADIDEQIGQAYVKNLVKIPSFWQITKTTSILKSFTV